MARFKQVGYECRHLKLFDQTPLQPGVFYGILRGSSHAMHILRHANFPFWYIDNGYFDAQYIDQNRQKKMTGMFRIVKNDMIHEYKGEQIRIKPVTKRENALLLPPTAYSAMHLGITVEDWTHYWGSMLLKHGFKLKIRSKDSQVPLEEDLIAADIMLACNSMGVVKAIERGIPAYDTHGLFRDAEDITKEVFTPELKYTMDMLHAFYDNKQHSLDKIVQGVR